MTPTDIAVGSKRFSALISVGLMAAAVFLCLNVSAAFSGQAEALVLEDFRSKDDQGFPTKWEAQRSKARAQQSYAIQAEKDGPFLAAKEANQRVFKKIGWDPKAMPIVTWRWRLKTAPPPESDPIAAVFISLDTDLLVIPVATKYVWSQRKVEGTITEGGLFGASEIVRRTGVEPIGKWVEERVNAYEDFKRLHQHEPAENAWGISLLAGPGVEIDFGPIAVSAR